MTSAADFAPEPKVRYTDLTPAEFRARLAAAPIAYLPLGTLEWHGEHLPLGADGLQAQGFFTHLARRAGGIVLPMLFVGPDLHTEAGGQPFYGMDLVGFEKEQPRQLAGSAYWVDETLFGALLEAILAQLARAGFKIVVAHGHGPSTHCFEKHSAEWGRQFGLHLFSGWDHVHGDSVTGLQTDHAAANETSLMMALHPDLVQMDNLPSDPTLWPQAIMGQDPRLHAGPDVGQTIIRKNLAWLTETLRQALTTTRAEKE